jgi:uncharacterized protein YqhQ
MKIVGGMALPYGVQLESTEYSVKTTATYFAPNQWKLESEVRKKTALELQVRSAWYVPKVVKLWTIMIMKAKWPLRILLLVVFVLPVVTRLFTPSQTTATPMSPLWTAATLLMAVLLYVALGYFFWLLRGFHAAEHMAIAAYENYGADALEHLSEQKRFHPKCGGRIVVPLFIGAITATVCSHYVPARVAGFLPVLSFEVVLWIDALVGFDNIWLTNTISWYLQQYITTREPTDLELATGRAALKKLMAVHGEVPMPVTQ